MLLAGHLPTACGKMLPYGLAKWPE